VCVCVCVYMYVYMYMYVCIYIYIYMSWLGYKKKLFSIQSQMYRVISTSMRKLTSIQIWLQWMSRQRMYSDKSSLKNLLYQILLAQICACTLCQPLLIPSIHIFFENIYHQSVFFMLIFLDFHFVAQDSLLHILHIIHPSTIFSARKQCIISL